MIPPSGTPERLRYTYWYRPPASRGTDGGRIHYAESNIMTLNLFALVFNRLPDQAPFFIKPLLRAIGKKAESGTSHERQRLTSSFLWSGAGYEPPVY
jgi:glutathione S-transferase